MFSCTQEFHNSILALRAPRFVIDVCSDGSTVTLILRKVIVGRMMTCIETSQFNAGPASSLMSSTDPFETARRNGSYEQSPHIDARSRRSNTGQPEEQAVE